MPILSSFYGIIVKMHSESNCKHHLPHVHVEYGEYEAIVTFDGKILRGTFPPSKMKLLTAWLEIHKDELEANWKIAINGEPVYKIDPLK